MPTIHEFGTSYELAEFVFDELHKQHQLPSFIAAILSDAAQIGYDIIVADNGEITSYGEDLIASIGYTVEFIDELTVLYRLTKKQYSYSVPVCYESWGRVTIQAESFEDAIQKLNDPYFINDMPLPQDPQYLEDSYVIDDEGEIENNETGEFHIIKDLMKGN